MDTEAKGDLFLIIGIFVVLFIVWLSVGGPSRETAQKPFVTMPSAGGVFTEENGLTFTSQDSQSEYYGRDIFGGRIHVAVGRGDRGGFQSRSIYGEKVYFIHGASGAEFSTPSREYLTIEASPQNREPIAITGWRVRSTETGKEATIGSASKLPFAGRVNEGETVWLPPGARAYLVTGESPIGTSFRANACVGYFGQFQEYHPPLFQHCPLPHEALRITDEDIERLGQACIEYITRVPRCTAVFETLPPSFNSACKTFIQNELTYSGCVDRYSTVEGFYEPEWRLFFNRREELWRNSGDTLVLVDPEGVVVDQISY